MSFTDVLFAFAGILGLFTALAVGVLSLTWLERKTLARIQQRAGPSVVGPHGLLQPVADAIKLMTKEDIIPAYADKVLFWMAPVFVAIPAFLIWLAIPFGDNLAVRVLDLGLLYLVAISGLGVVGLLMGGWASSSRYSMLGGLRAAAQLVSYEIPIVIVILSIAALVQSLSLDAVINGNSVTIGDQVRNLPSQGSIPFAFVMPMGLVIFVIAGLAELGRTPFDIHHAESEVVGGPFVEYSGAHWAVFFLAEYLNTFVISALIIVLFFGGWSWPNPPESLFGNDLSDITTDLLGGTWFMIKTYFMATLIFWVRATYPRLRIDQLMAFAWQVLIPLSFVNLVLVSVVLFYGWSLWVMTAVSLLILVLVSIAVRRSRGAPGRPQTVRILRRSAGEIGLPVPDLANQPASRIPGEGQVGN
ncbi:MAG TPA: NADH-quinone oxidoreductase subunit NuoH [Dehalococcoidia bacterium]|nr:NADH-quinone oxidoreductase subunit NuoH [Chloroflexota bacterium]MDP5877320.1 NADH-quinone oxidoreductase subunit NuoH [Dehalococcoidia bacterium]MDP7159981.1 NADH-quinone oxidoreductase subunit NuoH [Dehalococcoidia bacterium]MDP7212403.1 NADH-quinone oxidoreductase subunit NuoH [Dehalococcoidia bacterium]MDP7513802.1 NADH-quinone oxidoreductase subunit NuoH [Dehalococcoidia bacterium]